MTPKLNCQHFLAKQSHDEDLLVRKASYEAFLVIKKWRYINNLSYLNKAMKKEADKMIQKHLFNYLDNHELLNSAGYFEAGVQN